MLLGLILSLILFSLGLSSPVPEVAPVKTPEQIKECIKEFLTDVFQCIPVQENHPFCDETNSNYNPIACAIVLNKCLMEEMEGILNCGKD